MAQGWRRRLEKTHYGRSADGDQPKRSRASPVFVTILIHAALPRAAICAVAAVSVKLKSQDAYYILESFDEVAHEACTPLKQSNAGCRRRSNELIVSFN